jgi:hypothetical protein
MREFNRDYVKKWRQKNPEKQHIIDSRAKQNLKLKVLEYLGGAKCARCGCTVFAVLEINHLNLGGHKDQKTHGYWQLLRSILREQRKNEFNVLCHVCNAAHYIENKFGLKYEISLS